MSSSALPPLAALVPHRPPMLLVDEVVAHEGRSLVARAVIRGDHPFLEEGGVPALVAIELFAQTAAALVGLLAPPGGPSMSTGALLGTREVRLHVPSFAVGDELLIRCTEAWGVGPAAQIDCTLERDGVTIAQGSINVMAGEPMGASAARAARERGER
jgi:predicted hotdog family 3-hydroxylacyl-ACP dehydratase